MSNTILDNELTFLKQKFKAFHDETKKTCRFEKYLQELLTAESVECFNEKYQAIHTQDTSFTLRNINDRLIKNLEGLKTTTIFCIEAQVDQIMRQFKLAQHARLSEQ